MDASVQSTGRGIHRRIGWWGGYGRIALVLLLLAPLIAGCRRAAPATPQPTSWLTLAAPSPIGKAPTTAPVLGSAPAAATAGPAPTRAMPPTRLLPSPTAIPLPSPTPVPTKPSQPILADTLIVGQLPAAGHNPAGVAVLDGQVYVANRLSGNVSLIADGAVRQVVAVGGQPSAVVADPQRGRVFVLNELDKTISVLEKGAVAQTWSLPEAALSLAMIGDELWVGLSTGGRILALSPQDGKPLGEIRLSADAPVFTMLPAPQGGRAYVATFEHVTVVDPAARQEVRTVKLNSYQTLGLSPDGQRVYSTEYLSQTQQTELVALDATTLEAKARAPLPPDPAALVVDAAHERLFVLSSYEHKVVVIDGRTHEVIESLPVGLEPRYAALDEAAGRLFIANQASDSLAVIDTANLTQVATIPLAWHIAALEMDPISGRLYAAISSADQVLVYDGPNLVQKWPVGRHPTAVRVVPREGQVAALTRADASLTLYNQGGEAVRSYPTGPGPRSLTVNEFGRELYAGGTVIGLGRDGVSELQVQTTFNTDVAPVQVVMDTRRELLYAVAHNGIPGPSGGNIVYRLDERGEGSAPAAFGRSGVIDLIYDEELDQFYTTMSIPRLESLGLQISSAEDAKELAHIPLDRYPAAMALNPATHHLWVALQPRYREFDKERTTRVVAYDTRSLTETISFTLDGLVESIAVDQRFGRVYLGNDDAGQVQIVQDVDQPAPGADPNLKPTTAGGAPQAKATAPVAGPQPTCPNEVVGPFRQAWEVLGGAGGLGCALSGVEQGDWAVQPFEQGSMYWRGGPNPAVWVLHDDGRLELFPDTWTEGMPQQSCEATPPAGLQAPLRGFSAVWCREAGVREALGWAKGPERAFRGAFQSFDNGALFWDAEGALWALWSDGHWQRVGS